MVYCKNVIGSRKWIRKQVVRNLKDRYDSKGCDFTFLASQISRDTGLPPQCIGMALREEIENGGPVKYYNRRSSRFRYITNFNEV